mmetsp:Transcript_3112/g.4586  ORF Transcript_3112/g.4586 Transcript_3112/m.4586 type:complete len:83 (-) Transcript_3112:190-438(-)
MWAKLESMFPSQSLFRSLVLLGAEVRSKVTYISMGNKGCNSTPRSRLSLQTGNQQILEESRCPRWEGNKCVYKWTFCVDLET